MSVYSYKDLATYAMDVADRLATVFPDRDFHIEPIDCYLTRSIGLRISVKIDDHLTYSTNPMVPMSEAYLFNHMISIANLIMIFTEAFNGLTPILDGPFKVWKLGEKAICPIEYQKVC